MNAALTARTVWVCINGINTLPGDSEGWTDRAVTWLQTRTGAKAEKWEYAAGFITRRLKQQSRAEKIARMIGFYQRSGFAVVLAGHSNGCDLIARVLALRGTEDDDGGPPFFKEPVRAAHLVAAAADWGDFSRALDEGDVQRIHLYGSTNDRALLAATVSRACFGWLGLGYGSLGLEGAHHAMIQRVFTGGHPVFDHSDDTMGHSTWWERGAQFELTMQLLTRNERDFAPHPNPSP